jgi:hypothetical protein
MGKTYPVEPEHIGPNPPEGFGTGPGAPPPYGRQRDPQTSESSSTIDKKAPLAPTDTVSR